LSDDQWENFFVETIVPIMIERAIAAIVVPAIFAYIPSALLTSPPGHQPGAAQPHAAP
jgi:hypothetical protein